MKSYALFQEYIWLVNTIHRAHSISFDEIDRRWMQTEMSGGLHLPKTTFKRHKQAIEDIFGLLIECDRRNDYSYHIINDEVLSDHSIQNWMLSTLSIGGLFSDCNSIQDRILLESIPSTSDALCRYLAAMKSNQLITVTYRRYDAPGTRTHTVEPYCLKLMNKRWYGLVRNPEKGHFFVVSFDRVLDLTVIEQEFTMDKDFWAESYFADSYGILRREDVPVQRVVIRAFGREIFYLRDLPFHHSQKEIASGDDYSDFELFLRPTNDFYTPLLSRGPNIKVLEPEWLVEEIKEQLNRVRCLYDL